MADSLIWHTFWHKCGCGVLLMLNTSKLSGILKRKFYLKIILWCGVDHNHTLSKSAEDIYDLGSKDELEETIRSEILRRMEVIVAEGSDNGWMEAKTRQNGEKMEEKSKKLQQLAKITSKFGDEILELERILNIYFKFCF